MRIQRRGTIYIMTLGTALIVGMLAAAALLAVRTQRRQADLAQEMLQARLNAQAGLEMALFRIEENSNWRQLLTADTWATPASTPCGAYSFLGVDPDDANLTDDDFDPVGITATGTCGPATQKIAVRLEMRNMGLRCLEPGIHSKGNLVLDATTVNGDRLVSSNARTSAATGSQIYVAAESKLNLTVSEGSVFHAGTSTDGDWPREMPVAADALTYYQANGTAIDAADLPQWDAQQLTNPAMSDAATGWEALDACTLVLNAEASQTPWSLLIDGRSGPSDGPSQIITEKIQSGGTYTVSADAKAMSGEMNLRVSMRIVSTGAGTQTFSSTWTPVDSTAFITVSGALTPTWTGELTEARWFVESETGSVGFWFDDACLCDASAQAGFLALHRTVLSPANNPFGVGTTNAQGIYVIDCGGSPISIKDCRIFGTLVLLNYDDTQSVVHGSMSWEPSVASTDPAITNLPILMADGALQFSTSSDDLDEGLLNVNLNPTGTPHEGSADSDKLDTIPSLLDGLIFVNGNLDVTSSLRLHGVMVIDGVATFTNADVNATYDPLYYWYNAPPGFEADPAVDLVPGSFRRVVD
jgi:carbohydrate binding protein with CBM4/9 domain